MSGKKDLNASKEKVCDYCKGDGVIQVTTGRVVQGQNYGPEEELTNKTCPRCNGTGKKLL